MNRILTTLAGAVLVAGVATAPTATTPTASAAPTTVRADEAAALQASAQKLGLRFDPSTGAVAISEKAAGLTQEDKPAGAAPVEGEHRVVTTDAGTFVTDSTGALLGEVLQKQASSTDRASQGGAPGTDGGTVTFIPARAPEGGRQYAGIVGVPSDYVYAPSRGALHDYCTSSPDEFPNPFGANAPFQGPCARHDMCIERAGRHDHACDGPLRTDMQTNCRATYGEGGTRSTCLATSQIYYGAVTAASYF